MVSVALLKRDVLALIDEKRNTLTAIAEEMYNFPETGLKEFRAMRLLTGFLEDGGFFVEREIAGLATAFRAASGAQGPGIAILAEMDALPGLGHACGHNIIAAAAVGAAMALRRVLPPDAARIIVLGTPAEELGIGKAELIKAGFFQDIDFAMMVHPSSKRQVIKGFLGLAKVRFTFLGKAAHAAAYPAEGINALDGVIQTFNGINALRQQLREDVRVHGIITEGGIAPNIIPEKAACYFYVRADDLAEVESVRERLIACAEGAARASGSRLEIEADERLLAPLKINRSFCDLYSAQLAYLGLPQAGASSGKNKGSSDIGNVSQVVPTIHPHVPIGEGVRIHSEEFARASVSQAGQMAIVEGAKAMALTAVELATSPALRIRITEEFCRT
jgi:amidohydrolase